LVVGRWCPVLRREVPDHAFQIVGEQCDRILVGRKDGVLFVACGVDRVDYEI
jgi:hypothetical protein